MLISIWQSYGLYDSYWPMIQVFAPLHTDVWLHAVARWQLSFLLYWWMVTDQRSVHEDRVWTEPAECSAARWAQGRQEWAQSCQHTSRWPQKTSGRTAQWNAVKGGQLFMLFTHLGAIILSWWKKLADTLNMCATIDGFCLTGRLFWSQSGSGQVLRNRT